MKKLTASLILTMFYAVSVLAHQNFTSPDARNVFKFSNSYSIKGQDKSLNIKFIKADTVENVSSDVFFKDTDEFTATYDKNNTVSQEIHNQAFDLYKQGKWAELESLFKANNLNGGWPPANGGYNIQDNITIKAGEKYDRYSGPTPNWNGQGAPVLGGNFTSPIFDGASYSFGERALNKPENTYDFYYEIEVLQDLPFTGQTAGIIPWFGQAGNGKQTMWKIPVDPKTGYPKTWNQLAEEGFIKITIKNSPSGKYPDLINTVIK